MAPRTLALLPALLLLVACSSPAIAAVPSPVNSSVPDCFVACPLGDIPIAVTIRDLASNPVGFSSVVLDFSSCPGAYICVGPGSDPYIYDPVSRTIRTMANASGQASFPLRVGGVCGAGGVKIYADGVLMRSYALASPDQTGNGMVVCIAIDTDCDVFEGKVGTADPTADFDCDGDVDLDDRIGFGQHGSHACEGIVDPARRSSWGRVKAFYR